MGQNGTYDPNKRPSNSTVLEPEAQAEEQESALDELLKKVDLNSPLQVADSFGNPLLIPVDKFIQYYLPKDATKEEGFHCFNQTKAAGLNPMIAGECHYPRFGDAPLRLFTGYPVYLRKAYQNGLTHLDVEFELDDNGKIISVITTFDIEGREKPFVWQTWYSEVEGQTRGQTNWRWKKAPKSQTRKCGVVDGIRYSGLLIDDPLGTVPIIEEYSEPTIPGHKSLTADDFGRYSMEIPGETGEATPGPVTATTHQIDLTPLRKNYRGKIAEREIFVDDTQRKMWQSEVIGKASTADWDAEDFMNAVSEIESGRCEQWVADHPKPEPDPPEGSKSIAEQITEKAERLEAEAAQREAEEKAEQKGGDPNLDAIPTLPPKQTFVDEAAKRFASEDDMADWCDKLLSRTAWKEWTDPQFEAALPILLKEPLLEPENDTGETEPPTTPTEPEEEQEQAGEAMSKETGHILSRLVKTFPNAKYMTVASKSFRARAQQTIRHEIEKFGDLTENEANDIIASLREERKLLISCESSETVGGEVESVGTPPVEEDQASESDNRPAAEQEKASWEQQNEIYQALADLLPEAVNKRGDSLASSTPQARQWIFDTIGRPNPGIANLTRDEAGDVILALQDRLSDNVANPTVL